MNVDEPRGNGEAARVDLLFARRCKLWSDRSDERATDGDIHHLAVFPRSIVHSSIADHEVVIGAPEKQRGSAGDCDQRAGAGRDESSSIDRQMPLARPWIAKENLPAGIGRRRRDDVSYQLRNPPESRVVERRCVIGRRVIVVMPAGEKRE